MTVVSIPSSSSSSSSTCLQGQGQSRYPRSSSPFRSLLLLVLVTVTMTSVLVRHTQASGQWAQWSSWSRCSLTCDGGERMRSRKCDSLRPGLAAQCAGTTAEAEACNTQPCASSVDGHWTPWSTWSGCSLTCGFGTRLRTRTCDNPPPSLGGQFCIGVSNETANCLTVACPMNGGWTEWSNWTQCSATCGHGYISRVRSCTNPPPQWGGQPCPGLTIEMVDCVPLLCPVDGHWTEWTTWSRCSDTCSDDSSRTRWRFCADPAPAYGGRNCTGDSVEVDTCRQGDCRVNGGWSAWSEWQQCSMTCGVGEEARQRLCNNPSPAFGGLNCTGEGLETRWCQVTRCPVDCTWKEWSEWSDCTVPCGNGTQQRQRMTSPAQHGGKRCEGLGVEEKPCYQGECPIHGQWSSWTNWTECSATCGGGLHWRSRACNNPAPQYDGQPCLGKDFQNRTCSVYACPLPREKAEAGVPPKDAPKAASIGVTGLVFMALLFIAIVVFDCVTLRRGGAYRKENRSAFPKKVSLKKSIRTAATAAAAAAITPPRNGTRHRHRSTPTTTVTSQNGDVRLTVRLSVPTPSPMISLPSTSAADDDDGVVNGSSNKYDLTDNNCSSPADADNDAGVSSRLLAPPPPSYYSPAVNSEGRRCTAAPGALTSSDGVLNESMEGLLHELDQLSSTIGLGLGDDHTTLRLSTTRI